MSIHRGRTLHEQGRDGISSKPPTFDDLRLRVARAPSEDQGFGHFASHDHGLLIAPLLQTFHCGIPPEKTEYALRTLTVASVTNDRLTRTLILLWSARWNIRHSLF